MILTGLSEAVSGGYIRHEVTQNEHDLSPQDAIVYASVLSHLKRTEPQTACFLNKNSKDFDDPDISEMLERYQCQMLSRFDHGYQFIINKIRVAN